MLSEPPGAKEDPRVVRTRNLILNAFMELLPTKGFKSLTVRGITEVAGVNRATFYAHFPDKYALLDYAIREAFRQELERRALDAYHHSQDSLRALTVTVCEFVEQSTKGSSPNNPAGWTSSHIRDRLWAWILIPL